MSFSMLENRVNHTPDTSTSDAMDLEEAARETSAEELIVANGEDGKEVILAPLIDPSSGSLGWRQVRDGEATGQASVARSQMASMLKDVPRNQSYRRVIRHAVTEFTTKNGRAPRVLDIGTGTGLLALYAAEAGAKHVCAVEMFAPTAELARRVVEANNLSHIITVVAAMSTELVVGSPELPERVDIIVSETVDTGLLGEAFITSVRHALAELAVPNAVVVPSAARVFGRLVESDVLQSMARPPSTFCGVKLHGDLDSCQATLPVQGVHEEMMRPAPKPISETFPILDVDWTKPPPNGISTADLFVKCTTDGRPDAVLVYWELVMGDGGPNHSSELGASDWQDHWLQAAFLLPTTDVQQLSSGTVVTVRGNHDDTSMWFGLSTSSSAMDVTQTGDSAPAWTFNEGGGCKTPCSCTWHLLHNANRLWQLSDGGRTAAFEASMHSLMAKLVARADAGVGAIIDIGQDGLLGLAAAHAVKQAGRTSVNHVYSLQEHPVIGISTYRVGAENDISEACDVLQCSADEVTAEDIAFADKTAAIAVIAEPWFMQLEGRQLWTLASLWMRRSCLVSQGVVSVDSISLPALAHVRVALIGFAEGGLAEGHGMVGLVDGFKQTPLDESIQATQGEPLSFHYNLWQYDHMRLSDPATVFTADLCTIAAGRVERVELPVCQTGVAHGIAVWVDYDLDGTGTHIVHGDAPYLKQTVSFLPIDGRGHVSKDAKAIVDVGFSATSAEFTLSFCISH